MSQRRDALRAALVVIGVINIGLFAALVFLWFRGQVVARPMPTGIDLLDTTLTALSVILAALAIGLGAIGVVGYTAIRARAEIAAAKAARKTANAQAESTAKAYLEGDAGARQFDSAVRRHLGAERRRLSDLEIEPQDGAGDGDGTENH